jgi:hypothetical protein
MYGEEGFAATSSGAKGMLTGIAKLHTDAYDQYRNGEYGVDSPYNYSVMYYDDRGRLSQTVSDNPHGISKNELVSFIEKKFELLNQRFKYLNLAFNRDLKELREDFGLDIPYSKKHKIYTLNDYTINDSRIELLLNSFKIFSSLVNSSGLPEYIIPEKRKSNGIENFSILTEAINKKSIIEFYYFKYDINVTETKTVKPFALKESKNRWYLIGFYENTQEYRTFGLDRINNVTLTDRTYKKSPSIAEINDYFRDSFAMFTDEKTEFVKLSFDIRDGNYIKSYPIHTSQQIAYYSR